MPFTGQHAGVLILQALVLAKQVADLTAANANITGGHVGTACRYWRYRNSVIKALAETHDLSDFAVGSKSARALAAALGRAGVRLFLKHCSKRENFRIDRLTEGWKTQAAFVGTDGRFELHTVAAVGTGSASVIDPGTRNMMMRSGSTRRLDQAGLLVLGVGSHNRLQALEDFLNSLQKLLLLGGCAFARPSYTHPAGKAF